MSAYTIERLTTATFNEKEAICFLERYRLENRYLKTVGLLDEFSCPAEFFVEKIKRRLKNKGNAIWMQRDCMGTLVALWGVSRNVGLSKAYDKNLFKVDFLYHLSDGDKATAMREMLDAIDIYAAEEGIDYLRCKINMLDHATIYYLCREGYHYYAASEKFFLPYSSYTDLEISSDVYFVDVYRDEDLEACLRLLEYHEMNEKYYNLTFPRAWTLEHFRAWFLERVVGKAYICVCRTKVERRIVGVSVFSKVDIWQRHLMTWDLIIIAPEARGNNLSLLLFQEQVKRCKLDVEGSVMADNLMIHNKLREVGFVEVLSFVFLERMFPHVNARAASRECS